MFLGNSPSLLVGTGHFLVQFLQKLGALVSGEFALQFLEGEGDDVVVVRTGILGIGRDIKPKLVHELDVLRTHARRVGAEGIFADAAIGSTDFQSQPRARFGQALPGVARELRLLVGGELIG